MTVLIMFVWKCTVFQGCDLRLEVYSISGVRSVVGKCFQGEWVGYKSPESRLVLRLATVTCSLDDVHVPYEPFLVKVEAVFQGEMQRGSDAHFRLRIVFFLLGQFGPNGHQVSQFFGTVVCEYRFVEWPAKFVLQVEQIFVNCGSGAPSYGRRDMNCNSDLRFMNCAR